MSKENVEIVRRALRDLGVSEDELERSDPR